MNRVWFVLSLVPSKRRMLLLRWYVRYGVWQTVALSIKIVLWFTLLAACATGQESWQHLYAMAELGNEWARDNV